MVAELYLSYSSAYIYGVVIDILVADDDDGDDDDDDDDFDWLYRSTFFIIIIFTRIGTSKFFILI